MKKLLLFCGLLSLCTSYLFAQTSTIKPDKACINCLTDEPASSAVFEIQSTDKGILLPRMTTTERTNINSPADALLVYDTDTQSFWYYNASQWQELGASLSNQNLAQVLAEGNDANAFKIVNLSDPSNPQDAATKAYVDANTDPMNELQDLSLNGDTLSLSDDATAVDLSVFLNNWTITDGRDAVFGYNNIATGDSSTAVGYKNIANDIFSSAFGYLNEATGQRSNAFGYLNQATAFRSHAFGYSNEAKGNYSSAFGFLNKATGERSHAFGALNDATGKFSNAFGYATLSDVYGLMAVGRFNADPIGSPTTWVATEPVFVIGNGEDFNSRSTALTILKNGNVGIGDETPDELLEVNGNVKATKFIGDGSMLSNIDIDINDADADPMNELQDLSLSGDILSLSDDATTVDLSAFLNNWTTYGAAPIIFGFNNTVAGDSSSAVGYTNKATGFQSSAFGYLNEATGGGSSAFGFANDATGDRSSAVGLANDATGELSSAFGYSNRATGEQSSAVGCGALSDVYGLMAVGRWNADPVGSSTTWVATEPVFVVGNGENFSNRSTALTILKNGNVGIGTTTPDHILDVVGDTELSGSDNDGTTNAALKIKAGTQTMLLDGNEIDVVGDVTLFLNGNTDGDVSLTTASGGNVGIGIFTPAAKLDVNGTVRIRNLPSGSGTAVVANGNGNLRLSSSSPNVNEQRINDQQAEIEDLQQENELLKAENETIKARLAKIEALLSGKVDEINTTTSTLTSATLSQNAPNPFDEATKIDYFIPETVKSASLQVMDQNGRIIKRIPIQATGNGQITLQANLLIAGTYSYSLVLDGRVMESKQMVLTH